ncbi:MAG: Uma2 family endonuclease [Chloroflexota bacterium]|nr:Uma2 family endonuclease [Chloroflexota bacterium]MDE2958996.1 Uma2 family endonuclease [Chloroflexota bacterium]
MTTAKSGFKMLPYRRGGDIDYASLEFNPDRRDGPPDHMDQLNEIDEIMGLFRARFTDFGERPDVFLNRETFICYDPSNLNVRVSPDIYLAFGVDAQAITPRRLYLPWEVGKPPDFALEVASESTGGADVRLKPRIYAAIGVPEYWRFDPSGGAYHGAPLSGGLLVGGAYRPVPLTTEPDGILKGYSPILEISLAWDEGWPRLYDPAAGTYLEGWREVWHARRAAETRALTAEAEAALLREQLRRLRSEG